VEGTTVSEEESVGLSTSFSIGYQYENDLFGIGFSAKTSFESSFDYYAAKSKSITTYHARTTGDGIDKVVFTTIPFDVYYYTVVSSPESADVGEVVTVNLPRESKDLGTSIEFFNANNGNNFDIDEEILKHTAGDVWSYPTAGEKNAIMDAAEEEIMGFVYRLESNEAMSVENTGDMTLGISIADVDESGTSMSFGTTFEWEAMAGGATVGGSIGFQYGHSYSISNEKETYYEGTVAGLDNEHFPDYAYDVGLFVYPYTYRGQTFMVINWWTEQW
jgi:hypothetical protein